MRKNGAVFKEFACFIYCYHLATRAKTRVYSKHGLAAGRRRKQKRFKVFPEHLECLSVRFFPERHADLGFRCRQEQPFERVFDDILQMAFSGASRMFY